MLKVLYAGSPKDSAKTLSILIEKSKEANYEICGVLSNPPSSKGRHKALIPTEVAQVATDNNIPVFTPEHLDGACREEISKLNPDILVCFAYGHIFGPKFLSLFKFGGINLHPSALPKYRGCTPVPAAILNQDKETAFTVQKVSLAMDEGNILAQKIIPLNKTETAGSLLEAASVDGAELIFDLLEDIGKNDLIPEGIPQTGEASYTKIITKDDAKIDWNKSSDEIDAFVRGYCPEPTAWTLEKGVPLKILEGKAFAELPEGISIDGNDTTEVGTVCSFVKQHGIFVRCGSGFYAITKLQRQGKNPMDYKSFMNGARDFIGCVLV